MGSHSCTTVHDAQDGFEGREGHRTPFASAKSLVVHRSISQGSRALQTISEPERVARIDLGKVLSPRVHGHRYGNLRRSN